MIKKLRLLIVLIGLTIVTMNSNASSDKEYNCDFSLYDIEKIQVIFPDSSHPFFDIYKIRIDQEIKGAPVLLLHEITGLNCKAIRLAHQLVEEGRFDVYMPHFFGELGVDPGKIKSSFYGARLAIDSNWSVLSSDKDSPVIEQLDKLVTFISNAHDQKVGVIGMCLTGTFPIALMANQGMGAAVVSQPAMPLIAFTESAKKSLGISKKRLESAKKRSDVQILGFRYEKDNDISPGEKFTTLQTAFDSNFEDCTVTTGELADQEGAHSVLTERHAFEESEIRRLKTIEFLDRNLNNSSYTNEFSCP